MENATTRHTPAKAGKRSAAQRAADLVFIERLVLQGKFQAEIAELLSKERPYRLSRSMVQNDIERLKGIWTKAAVESFGLAQARALKKLELVEREAWMLHEKTKADGNADGLKKVLEVHDRVARLLGLDAAERLEMSGPAGAPIVIEEKDRGFLSQDEKDDLLMRHCERIRRRKAAQALQEGGGLHEDGVLAPPGS
jgi:hypothetical protein